MKSYIKNTKRQWKAAMVYKVVIMAKYLWSSFLLLSNPFGHQPQDLQNLHYDFFISSDMAETPFLTFPSISFTLKFVCSRRQTVEQLVMPHFQARIQEQCVVSTESWLRQVDPLSLLATSHRVVVGLWPPPLTFSLGLATMTWYTIAVKC